MKPFNVIVALLGVLVLVLGIGSKRLARGSLPPTLLALILGALLGPHVLGVVDLGSLADEPVLREKLARLTLGIALVGVALRIPRTFPRRHVRSMLVLIGLGMPLMWLVSTGLVYGILGLPFWLAAVIGAAITPTEPVAATPIVTGTLAEDHLPARIRHTISLESGLNDGAAYPLVLLPYLVLTMPVDAAVRTWVLEVLLWEVLGAALLGIAIGYAAGRLLEWAERHDTIEDDWRLIYTVAMALFALGAGRLVGSDEILVAFAAGAAFGQVVTTEDRKAEDRGQEAINRFFAIPIFAVIGLTIPWDGWAGLGWTGLLLAAAVLLLRRLPALLLLRRAIPTLHDVRETLFVGWFGPIAVAALYYASLMEHRLHEPRIWHVVSLVICASALAHGTTAAPTTRRVTPPGTGDGE